MDAKKDTKPKNDCAGCGKAAGVHPPEWRIERDMNVVVDFDAPTKTKLKFCNRCYNDHMSIALDSRDSPYQPGVGWRVMG